MRKIWIPLFFIPFTLSATDLKPWFPRYLEIQPQVTFLHTQYNLVDKGKKNGRKKTRDGFLNGSVEIAYDAFCGEIEANFCSENYKNFVTNDLSGTLRYQVFDDVIGDPVSVVVGATVRQVFDPGLKNITVFYHGGIEGEFHLSVGKEFSRESMWTSRAWTDCSLGIADHGSPWIKGEVCWEKNWCETDFFKLFAQGIYGLGHHDLHLSRPFNGYGSIRQQAIDVGASYKQLFVCNGSSLTFGYSRRVHAANCPKEVNTVFLTYLHPFGL